MRLPQAALFQRSWRTFVRINVAESHPTPSVVQTAINRQAIGLTFDQGTTREQNFPTGKLDQFAVVHQPVWLFDLGNQIPGTGEVGAVANLESALVPCESCVHAKPLVVCQPDHPAPATARHKVRAGAFEPDVGIVLLGEMLALSMKKQITASQKCGNQYAHEKIFVRACFQSGGTGVSPVKCGVAPDFVGRRPQQMAWKNQSPATSRPGFGRGARNHRPEAY